MDARTTAGLPPQQAKSELAGDPGLETDATKNGREVEVGAVGAGLGAALPRILFLEKWVGWFRLG